MQRIQAGSSILDRQYGYDPVGNITSINDALSGENLNFTYDPLDRLTSASGAFSEIYRYDAVGNMTSKAGLTFSYTDTLHKHAVTALSDESAYQYDRNGNMTRRLEAGISYTQTWDIDNHLANVAKGNSSTQYYYDADGALVRKVEPRGQTVYASADYEVFYPTVVTVTVPSTFTHKLYMPFVANAQTNGPCHDTCTYYRFNGQQIAIRTGGTVYWLHGDHLGSASATTDIFGTKVSELRYKPYGETRYSSGNTPTDKRFTSQEQQADIGLYSYGARFYDPQIGRFISADSIVPRPGDPQSLNRFAYTRNSPLVRVDPDGHSDTCNSTLYNCFDYGSNDPYVTSPTPEIAPVVTSGSPYPLLEANVLNPNDLHALAYQWVRTHPYYDPFADPNRKTTNWMGEVIPNGMFDFVRNALVKLLLEHQRQQEAEEIHGSIVDSLVQLGGAGIYIAGTMMTYGPTGPGSALGTSLSHGNSYASARLTYLYELVDKNTGAHLKWGITSEANPRNRYTNGFMSDKVMIIIDQGTRVDMTQRERTLTSSFPGPLNREPWAGTVPWNEP